VKKLLLVVLALAFIFAMSCGTTDSGKNTGVSASKQSTPPPKTIDHKYAALGKNAPDWLTLEILDLEKLKDYDGMYVFKFESEPKETKEAAALFMSNFNVTRAIARMISTRVQNKATTAVVGDASKVEAYMEEVNKVLAEATYTGSRMTNDYWVLREYYNPDGSIKYQGYIQYQLWIVPKTVVNKALKDAENQVAKKELNDDQKKARNLVEKASEEGM
jgi:hypothetical protein